MSYNLLSYYMKLSFLRLLKCEYQITQKIQKIVKNSLMFDLGESGKFIYIYTARSMDLDKYSHNSR